MEGLPVVLLVAVVGLCFTIQGVRYARRNPVEPSETIEAWTRIEPFAVAGATLLFGTALAITAQQLRTSYEYAGSALAQADFSLALHFGFFLLPAGLLLLFCLGLQYRYWPRERWGLRARLYYLNAIVDILMLGYGAYLFHDFKYVFMPLKFGQ